MKRLLLAGLGALALIACADTPSSDGESSDEAVSGCGAGLPNLNDSCNKKVQPTNRERSLTCPVVATSGFSASDNEVDEHAFDAVAPFDPKNPVRIAAVVIKRVNGRPI